MSANDKKLHGAYGDSVLPKPVDDAEVEQQEEQKPSNRKPGTAATSQGSKPNVQIYLKEIRKPEVALKLRRQGCAGWPCHEGYLCNFCLLRPEWTAEAQIGPMQVLYCGLSSQSRCPIFHCLCPTHVSTSRILLFASQEEIDELRHTVMRLRKQQSDVDTYETQLQC